MRCFSRYPAVSLLLGAVWMGMTAMAAQAQQESHRLTVLNKGVGGNSTQNGLARFQRDVEATDPDHLVIFFGMNDALNSAKLVQPDVFRRNLLQMIRRGRASGARTVALITLNPIVSDYVRQRHPSHPAADLDAWLARYDTIIREVATVTETALIDLRDLVLSRGVPPEDRRSLVRNELNSGSADGVHLTAAGYERLAQRVALVLQPALKAGDVVVCFGDSLTYGAHMQGAGTADGETYPAYLRGLLLSHLQQNDSAGGAGDRDDP